MIFADLKLSQRLERAEATASALFAEARRHAFPDCGACWTEVAGAYAIFDGVASPCTQTFGLGLFEELNSDTLDRIERFFFDRSAPVLHEVSPFAGTNALDLLCRRNYTPEELSSVLYQPLLPATPAIPSGISVRICSSEDAALWNEINAKAWAYDHPELLDFLIETGAIFSAREQCHLFVAEADGVPAAAGALCIHQGVALLAGAATLPEFRGRGLQSALLAERMRHALAVGCDLAMMVTLPGSSSQRNAERNGFGIAYTRTKWRLRTSLAT